MKESAQNKQLLVKAAEHPGAASFWKESEKNYQAVFENIKVPIIITDKDLNVICVNAMFEKLLGHDRYYLAGKNVRTLLTASENLQKVLENHWLHIIDPEQAPDNYEIVSSDKDGNLRYLILNVSIMPESEYLVVSLLDVTEQRQAELKFKASENYYRTIFENTGAATLMMAEDMTIIKVNRESEKVFGYTNKELIGLKWTEIIHEDYIKQMTEYHYLRRIDPTAVPVKYKVRVKDKQGKFRSGLLVVDLIPGTKNSLATFVDFTDYNRLDRALKTINACNPIMIYAETEADLLSNICRTIVDVGGYSMCWVGYLQDDKKQTVLPVAYAGNTGDYIEKLNISLKNPRRGYGPTGLSIRTAKPVVTRNIENDEFFKPWVKNALQQGYKSNMSIPLMGNEKVFGALNIYAGEADRFDQEEERLLTEMANNLAYSITYLRTRAERNRTVQEMKIYLEKLQRLLSQAANALGTVLEKRDPYTAGHQSKVAALSVAIAEEMKLSGHQVAGISAAASLHDIGKITVPSEILSKPGELSELEFAIVKTHCQVGYEIIREIDFPWPVADVILQHHERIDGSGYPKGLIGEEIMLEARIIAVADVVEAMASHRPYRPTLGIDKALEEISDNKGILYDLAVVEACLKLFKEKNYIFSG